MGVDHQSEDGIDFRKVMETINQRIEILLGREYLLGHSYFMSLQNDMSISNVKSLFCEKIIPLLQEYFFDDWSKIYRVLGDHQKPLKYQMITNRYTSEDISRLLGDDWGTAVGDSWEINQEALGYPQSYIGIYEPIKESL